ncbi:hypothetical protein [Bacillus cereus]|uniref:hypothetical protein n=1 Tax=Bacillus cereus TaxID=1396 RepID=UPI000BED78F7|nr:hypothetical protein [Bacillus cereus]PEF61514.1 hypothetical protein CON35_24840 [Bacillus cereus]
MDNNVHISITNPQTETREWSQNYLTNSWLLMWIVLIIVFVLLVIIGKGTDVYSPTIPMFFPNKSMNGVQTNINQDKLYITNGNTGILSIVDTKTDQLKSILPFL